MSHKYNIIRVQISWRATKVDILEFGGMYSTRSLGVCNLTSDGGWSLGEDEVTSYATAQTNRQSTIIYLLALESSILNERYKNTTLSREKSTDSVRMKYCAVVFV